MAGDRTHHASRNVGGGGCIGTVSPSDSPSVTIMWNKSHYLAARIPPISAICIELKNDQSCQHHPAFKCVWHIHFHLSLVLSRSWRRIKNKVRMWIPLWRDCMSAGTLAEECCTSCISHGPILLFLSTGMSTMTAALQEEKPGGAIVRLNLHRSH